MEVGITLEIQAKGVDCRLVSKLIGIEEGKYLIIKTPEIQSSANALRLLYRGNNVIVRYISKGSIFGFQSNIIDFITDPRKLIFIEYPKKIENKDIRHHKRIDCYLPAGLIILDNVVNGFIIDISGGGCQFVTETSRFENYIQLMKEGFEFNVAFHLPGIEKILEVRAKQRNIKKDNKNINIGMMFSKMEPEVEVKLNKFLSKARA